MTIRFDQLLKCSNRRCNRPRWLYAAVLVLLFSACGQQPEAAILSEESHTETDFNRLIRTIVDAYDEEFSSAGATLRLMANWSDDAFGAKSAKSGSTWLLMASGGTLRVPEATRDGFSAIICHEMGHLFGGAPYLREGIAAEAQADFYAAGTCLPRIWSALGEVPDEPASTHNPLLPAPEQSACEQARSGDPTLSAGVCRRVLRAARSALWMSAARKTLPAPEYGTPDPSEVDVTITTYPSYQCRLDTWRAGTFDEPRPRCWFHE